MWYFYTMINDTTAEQINPVQVLVPIDPDTHSRAVKVAKSQGHSLTDVLQHTVRLLASTA